MAKNKPAKKDNKEKKGKKDKGSGKRMKKDSFYWYKHVIETNGEEL